MWGVVVNSIRSARTDSPREIWPEPCQGELGCGYLTGRACERKAKSVTRAIGDKPNRRTAGQSPVVALMVGDGMAGSPCDRNQGDPPGPKGVPGRRTPSSSRPQEPPGGSQSVRSSEEAGNDRGAKGRRKVDDQ